MFRQEKPLIHVRFYWNREILARFSWHESVDSQSALPRSFLAAVSLGHQASCLSAVVEDESPAVAKSDLFGLPGGALVEAFRLCAGWVPLLIEPVEVRVFIRDPFLDRLPGWFDGLHGVIRPPRPADSPFGLRLRLRPKRLRSLGVVQCRRAAVAGVEDAARNLLLAEGSWKQGFGVIHGGERGCFF